MKRKYITCFFVVSMLASVFSFGHVGAAAQESTEEMVKLVLVSEDGTAIEVPEDRARQSITILGIIDDIGLDEMSAGVPVPNVSQLELQQIFGDGGFVQTLMDKDFRTPLEGGVLADVGPGVVVLPQVVQEAEFMPQLATLVSLLLVINYLDIPYLFQVLEKKLAALLTSDVAMARLEQNPSAIFTVLDPLPNEVQVGISTRIFDEQKFRAALAPRLIFERAKGSPEEEEVWSTVLSGNGRYLAAVWSDALVEVYDLLSANPQKPIFQSQHNGDLVRLALSATGQYLVAGCAQIGGNVDVYDLWSVAPQNSMFNVQFDDTVLAVSLTPDGRYLAVGTFGYDQATGALFPIAYVYDLQSETPQMPIFENRHENDVLSVALSADGRYLATAAQLQGVQVFDLRGRDPQKTPIFQKVIEPKRYPINTVALSADGRLLAIGTGFGNMSVFDVRAENPKTPIFSRESTVDIRDNRVHTVIFSADGRYLAAGRFRRGELGAPSGVGSVEMYDLKNGKEILFMSQAGVEGRSLGLSADGELLAVGMGNRVLVYDVALPRNIKMRYLTLPQSLLIILASKLRAAGRSIPPYVDFVRTWNSFAPEDREFLLARYGDSSLSRITKAVAAATKIQATMRGFRVRRTLEGKKGRNGDL